MSILLGKGEKAGIGKLTCELALSGFGRWNSKIAAVRFAGRVVPLRISLKYGRYLALFYFKCGCVAQGIYLVLEAWPLQPARPVLHYHYHYYPTSTTHSNTNTNTNTCALSVTPIGVSYCEFPTSGGCTSPGNRIGAGHSVTSPVGGPMRHPSLHSICTMIVEHTESSFGFWKHIQDVNFPPTSPASAL